MPTIWRLGRWIIIAALLALAFGQQAPARAQVTAEVAKAPSGPGASPLPPPGCLATTRTFSAALRWN